MRNSGLYIDIKRKFTSNISVFCLLSVVQLIISVVFSRIYGDYFGNIGIGYLSTNIKSFATMSYIMPLVFSAIFITIYSVRTHYYTSSSIGISVSNHTLSNIINCVVYTILICVIGLLSELIAGISVISSNTNATIGVTIGKIATRLSFNFLTNIAFSLTVSTVLLGILNFAFAKKFWMMLTPALPMAIYTLGIVLIGNLIAVSTNNDKFISYMLTMHGFSITTTISAITACAVYYFGFKKGDLRR